MTLDLAMTDLTRRSFLRGVTALTVLAITPGLALSASTVAPAWRVAFRLEQGREHTQGLVSFRLFIEGILPNHKGFALVKFELMEPYSAR